MKAALRSTRSAAALAFTAGIALFGATQCGGEAQNSAGSPLNGSPGGSSGAIGGTGPGVPMGGTSSATGGTSSASGGTSSASGGTSSAGGGTSACGATHSPAIGRPQATRCAVTVIGLHAEGCNLDADCADAGVGLHCLSGQCTIDQCLTDTDCAVAQACRCTNQVGGNGPAGNACVPTGCRVDDDCGPGGTCSPDTSGRCGSFDGNYCHSAADTCNTNADCCEATPLCGYRPELGHWACAAVTVCNG